MLRELQLNDLSENWTDAIWSKEFLAFDDDVPEDYSSLLRQDRVKRAYQRSISTLKCLLEGDERSTDSNSSISWQTLVNYVPVRKTLALLGYLMYRGIDDSASDSERDNYLTATSFYFTLLAVPGSSAFRIFHPNLYERAIDTFNLSCHLTDQPETQQDYDDDETNEPPVLKLTKSQKEKLTEGLNNVMYNFILMLKSFSLSENSTALQSTISHLLEVAKLELQVNHFETKKTLNRASLTALSYNAYVALSELCDQRHGPTTITVKIIMHHLLKYFMANYTELPARGLAVFRETIVSFLHNLLKSFKDATAGVNLLISHLIKRCPERADARQRQANIVVYIINFSNHEIVRDLVDAIVINAHHNKVSNRVFALEIVGKFIDIFKQIDENLRDIGEESKRRIERVLLGTLLSRCKDSSTLVRGKAMSILTENCKYLPKNFLGLRDLFLLKERRQQFPTIDMLRLAITEELDFLPGYESLVEMLSLRVSDERAYVRRSSLLILKNVVLICPELLDKTTYYLSEHCRDQAMVVRCNTIQIMTELVDQFPDSENLLVSWVKSVVPQTFDVETKVHEIVVESMRTLIFNNVAHLSRYHEDQRSSLPWRITREIVRTDMRKHLSKVCNVLIKLGIKTDVLIRNVKSHLSSSDNKEPAWVLLAAIAENCDRVNIDDQILNIAESAKTSKFITNVMLHVLRCSWHTLSKENMRSIYNDLYRCLSNFEVHAQLITTCVDIVNNVYLHLHKETTGEREEHMLSLAEQSEREIMKLQGGGRTEQERLLRAICSLGQAMFLCPRKKISSDTLHELQAIVLGDLSTSNNYSYELQASAVALLSAQALRDREIAQEIMPILGNLMSSTSNQSNFVNCAVRINAAKALADLCTVFGDIVAPHMPEMCVSMKDPDPAVRKVIIIIFTQLLLEDFIKIKGAFFFHILTMLTDADEPIRNLTTFLITERLLTKNKTLISQRFVDSLFHYNNYPLKGKVNWESNKKREVDKALALPGQRNQAKRRVIYNFMIEHLDLPGRLKVVVKLTNNVLGSINRRVIKVDNEEGACVLKDTLYVLSHDSLQPSSCLKRNCDEETLEPETENPHANSVAHQVAEGMKKQRVDALLPVLVQLKQKLKSSKSNLDTDITKLLVKIASDYSKDQLTKLFNEFPKLEKQLDEDKR